MAAIIAAAAYRRNALSGNGALAAFVLGSICAGAGWSWAALLVGFFITGTLLSKYKAEGKARRSAGLVAKGGARDAWQVLANGGVFATAAAASIVHPSSVLMFIGAGAIAAAAADTWATEIGMLATSAPRSIISWRPVSPGQSGGVTLLGIFAGALGAATIGLIALAAGWGSSAAGAAVVGGIGGCILDSVLGATLQTQRWCDHCNTITERRVHDCGTTTRVTAGLSWMDNDAVNAACTAFGALLGFAWNIAAQS